MKTKKQSIVWFS